MPSPNLGRKLGILKGGGNGLPDFTQVSCSYIEWHHAQHVKHPLTGRRVCPICHPVPPVSYQIAEARARAAKAAAARRRRRRGAL